MNERIVIVGAGYAGLWAAKVLAHRLPTEARLTVINDRDHFVERVRMHQHAAGQALSRIRLTDVFAGTDTEVIVDRVTGLRPTEQIVDLESRTVGYDRLIYALGSAAAPAPGDTEEVATPAGAERLRQRLAGLRSGTVVVVGGGLTGLETVSEIGEGRPELSVRLISADPIDAGLTPAAGRYLRSALDRLGVQVSEGRRVTATTAGGLVCDADDGGEPIMITADLMVWATGYRAQPYAQAAGLAVDEMGRIRVDGNLRSISDQRIYAVGDSAAVPMPTGDAARMCCQIAVPMGFRAGNEVVRLRSGRSSRPHRPRFVWRTISLGRADGVVQFTTADDRPLPIFLRGRAAARYKEFILSTVAWLTTGRRPGSRADESSPKARGRRRVLAGGTDLRNSLRERESA